MRIAVIPAYKPQEIFIDVLKAAFEAGFKIIVVDDGSGPGYSDIFARARQYAHVISYPENKGKGFALKTAFSRIIDTYEYEQANVVTFDCDGQHKIKDVIKVCEVSESNPKTLVLGSRKQSKSSPLKSRVGNGITKHIFFMSTGVKVEDTQTGLRAFEGSILPMFVKIKGKRYEYEMNVLLRLAKSSIKIIEVPIETIYIQNNVGSHFKVMRDSASIFAEILKFSASSFIGFLVDYSFYSLILWLSGSKAILLANILARVISATVNFTINYKFVFKSKESLTKSLMKYLVLACFILICNSCLLYLLAAIGKVNPFVSKVLVELILFIASWLIQRTFVFVKGRGSSNK
ncbi:MAG TPA: glycosyltransferase [Clostridiales bacterium]|nr:glycosyltransferase [Clostridiales bacterium]